MDTTLTATLVTLIVGGVMNYLIWLGQKRANKKKESAELDKTAADTDNIDSDTIQNLVSGMADLQDLYEEQREKHSILSNEYDKQSSQITMLESSYEVIVRQNKKLLQEAAEMRERIADLEDENASLRKLITDEQIKKRKL